METEGGQKENDHLIYLKRSDSSHGPSITLPPTPLTVTALSGVGSMEKIQLFKLKLFGAPEGVAGFLSHCCEFRLTEPSSSRMERGGGGGEMVPEV